jgi:hypothetical protein
VLESEAAIEPTDPGLSPASTSPKPESKFPILGFVAVAVILFGVFYSFTNTEPLEEASTPAPEEWIEEAAPEEWIEEAAPEEWIEEAATEEAATEAAIEHDPFAAERAREAMEEAEMAHDPFAAERALEAMEEAEMARDAAFAAEMALEAAFTAEMALEAETNALPPYRIRLKIKGKERHITCGDGQRPEVTDIINLTFDASQYCRVEIDGGMGILSVGASGYYSCINSGQVFCSKTR